MAFDLVVARFRMLLFCNLRTSQAHRLNHLLHRGFSGKRIVSGSARSLHKSSKALQSNAHLLTVEVGSQTRPKPSRNMLEPMASIRILFRQAMLLDHEYSNGTSPAVLDPVQDCNSQTKLHSDILLVIFQHARALWANPLT